MTSRIFIALAATWLIVSAFLWPHTDAQLINTALTGAIMLALALLSMVTGAARYLCLASAAWLFVSTLRIAGARSTTMVNNIVIAAAVFFAAMLIGEPKDIRREKELYGRSS